MAGNTFDAGSIESRLTLDRSDFTTGLREAKTEGENFARQSYTATLKADARGVFSTVAQVRAELASLRDVNLNIGVSGTNAQIRAISQSASALDGRQIGLSVNVTGIAEASAQLRTLRQQVRALDGQNIRIHVDLDENNFTSRVAALRAQLTGLNRSLNSNRDGMDRWRRTAIGTAGTTADLAAVIVAAVPAIVPLGAAFLNVAAGATAMGIAVGGSLGIFGLAVKGAVTNAQNLQKALDAANKNLATQRQALSQLKPGTDEYANQLHKVDLAWQAVNEAQSKFTPAQRQFITSVNGMKTAWQGFIGSTQNQTLPIAATALNAIRDALPQLVPVVNALAPEMQRVATSFHNWVTDGGLERFVKVLVTDGVPAVHNLITAGTNLAGTFGFFFRQFAQNSESMSGSIARVTGQLNAWAAGGGFSGFVGYVNANAPQVRDFMDALWQALKNISNAFQDLGNPSLRFVTLLLRIVGALPPPVLDALVAGFIAWRAAVLGIAAATAIWAAANVAWETVSSPMFLLLAGASLTILAVVAAIAALAVGIYFLVKNWDTVQHGLVVAWNATWNAMKVAALATWDALVTGWTATTSALTAAWDATWGALRTAGLATWNALTTAWDATANAFVVAGQAIATAALWLWNTVLSPTFNAISIGARLLMVIVGTVLVTPWVIAFHLLRQPVTDLYNLTVKPVFALVVTAARTMMSGLQVVFGLVQNGVRVLAGVVQWLWTNAFKPVFGFIVDGARIWWTGVQLYFNAVVTIIRGTGAAAVWLWTNAFKPVFGWIVAGAQLWWSGVQLYFNTVIRLIRAVGAAAVWLWTNGFRPAYGWITSGSRALYSSGIKPSFDFITSAIKTLGSWAKWLWTNGIKPQWDAITRGTSTLKDGMVKLFDDMKTGIGKVWDGVRAIAAKPINFVIDTVYNHGIVEVWNKISHAVGLDKMKLSSVSPIKYAAGGAIQGGIAGRDSVPLLGMPGEHIWTAEEVKNFGGQQAMAAFRSLFSSTGKARVAPGVNGAGKYGLGGAIAGAAGDVWDTAKNAGKAATGAVTKLGGVALQGLDTLVQGAMSAVVGPILNHMADAAASGIAGVLPGNPPYEALMKGYVKAPFNWIKDFVAGNDKKAAAGWTGGSLPTSMHKSIIDAALTAASVPPPGTLGQWEAGLNTLIGRESGWNPNAVNRTDINAQLGHPSQGLAQTIPSTFNSFVPSSLRGRGILDPIANVAAAIRYIVSRYGNITSVQQANASAPPKGYFGGGVTTPGLHMFGEKGPELVATSGGDRVFTAQETQRMLASASAGGGGTTVIRFPDHITVRIGEQEFTAYLDEETRAAIAKVFDEADRSR